MRIMELGQEQQQSGCGCLVHSALFLNATKTRHPALRAVGLGRTPVRHAPLSHTRCNAALTEGRTA